MQGNDGKFKQERDDIEVRLSCGIGEWKGANGE
jgi:hypothetical protein